MRHATVGGGVATAMAYHRPFFGGPLNLNLHKAAIAAGPVQLRWTLDRTLCIA